VSDVMAFHSFTAVAGDDLTLQYVVTKGGEPVDPTSMTIEFGVSRSPGADPVVETSDVDITVLSGAAGVFEITASSLVTAGLLGTYWHEAKVTDAEGVVTTIARGLITFKRPVISLASTA
jgi:hypothetical protein